MQTISKITFGKDGGKDGRPLKEGCRNPSWVWLINDGNLNWVMEGIKVEKLCHGDKDPSE